MNKCALALLRLLGSGIFGIEPKIVLWETRSHLLCLPGLWFVKRRLTLMGIQVSFRPIGASDRSLTAFR